jgi:hypothetical protein
MNAIEQRVLFFANRAEWRAWLRAHHDGEVEVWVAHLKKASRSQGLPYEEGVEEALCYGWIDGLTHSLDADYFMQRYTPRKPNSLWSESNKARVEMLIRRRRLTAAGLRKVAAAKANGPWDAAAQRQDRADTGRAQSLRTPARSARGLPVAAAIRPPGTPMPDRQTTGDQGQARPGRHWRPCPDEEGAASGGLPQPRRTTNSAIKVAHDGNRDATIQSWIAIVPAGWGLPAATPAPEQPRSVTFDMAAEAPDAARCSHRK